MGITRKELEKVYEEVKAKYRRTYRDSDIVLGINELYKALINYIDGEKYEQDKL